MTEKQEPHFPLIDYLETKKDDRGVMAALRRGLGQPPGTIYSMYRYVVPFLGDEVSLARDAAYYLVAALYAYHPMSGDLKNLGASMALLRDPKGENNDALERRFTVLLAAHPDDLDVYLRQAIGVLKSKDIPVNWHQLLADVLAWGHPNRYVQRNWAHAFWSRAASEPEPQSETPSEPGNTKEN